MKTESVEKMIDVIATLMNENSRLTVDISLLEREYSDLSERFLKLEHEYECLSQFASSVDTKAYNMSEVSETLDTSDSSDAVPVNEMAKTTPATAPKNDGIFPSPASAVHSMVTGTTDQECFALTAVIKDISHGPNVSRRILREQNLFEYRKDECGNNRMLPTEWFKEYAISHGILAEFTGHTMKRGKEITFSWFKVTPQGVDIIRDTAAGKIVWKKFEGPNEYIPVPVDTEEN